MIQFHSTSYRIAGRTILDGVDLEVREGETLALLGRSGSGKTTALRMVNAMRFPTEGEVLVDGQSTEQWNPVTLRRSIGYVIQEVGLFPHWTVARNVGTVPELLGWPRAQIAQRVEALLDEVGLAPTLFRERFPHQLSGGQRQRVGVARALAANPRILHFDEPFGALDPITRREMQELFRRLREAHRLTCVFVTHDLEEALCLGTRIALLVNGRVDTLATPAAFLQAQSDEAKAFLATLPETLR